MILKEVVSSNIRKVGYEAVVFEFQENVLTEDYLCIFGSWGNRRT